MIPARTRFLHRRSYRQRRIADAVRMLPVAGLILMMLPLLHAGGETARTSRVGLYIFAVWVGLMLVALGLSRGLRDPKDRAEERAHPAIVTAPDPMEPLGARGSEGVARATPGRAPPGPGEGGG